MVKQLLNAAYSIKRIIDGPKAVEEGGKTKVYYKVRWQDTYEPVQNLPKKEIDLYRAKKKRKANVCGPVPQGEDSFKEMHFAVEIDSNVQLMPYKKLKTDHKDELIAYFEKNALLRPREESEK